MYVGVDARIDFFAPQKIGGKIVHASELPTAVNRETFVESIGLKIDQTDTKTYQYRNNWAIG